MHLGFVLVIYFTEINKMYADLKMNAAYFKTIKACRAAEKRFYKKFPTGTPLEIDGKVYQIAPSCQKEEKK